MNIKKLEEMKIYKLVKEIPGYNVGTEFLSDGNDYYPDNFLYKIPNAIVENSPDFFKLANTIDDNTEFYYISYNGIILSDKFIYENHYTLLEYGNVFVDLEKAKAKLNDIKTLFKS